MLGKDHSVGVGDDDYVFVADDKDLFEGVVHVDHVGDRVQADGAGGADSSGADAVGQVGCWSRRGPRAWCRPIKQWPNGFGTWRVGFRRCVPRGLGCDSPRESLVGSFGVVDVIERVDLGLELSQGVGQWLLVQVAEQRLVETFILSLCGRLVGLAGDRFHPERAGMFDELTDVAAT